MFRNFIELNSKVNELVWNRSDLETCLKKSLKGLINKSNP